MQKQKLPKEVIEKVGHYVYLYIHPDTEEIFYVGQGKGNRVFSHLTGNSESEKAAIIAELKAEKKEPKIDILIHGLPSQTIATKVEAAVIDLIGQNRLSNKVRGWGSGQYGRMNINELVAQYYREPVTISEPSVLIRINKLYRFGMSPVELYDVTRGRWKISKKRKQVQLAFAVFDSVIKEVYSVTKWFQAGTTFSTRKDKAPSDRWEFVGNIADDSIRSKYINRSVADYFQKGSRNPIRLIHV